MIEVFEPSRHLTDIAGRLVILTKALDGNRLSQLGTIFLAVTARGDQKVMCSPLSNAHDTQAISIKLIAVVCDTMQEADMVKQLTGSPEEIRKKVMALAGLPTDDEPVIRRRTKPTKRGDKGGGNKPEGRRSREFRVRDPSVGEHSGKVRGKDK